jgi:cytoskeletal protein CcmA (bactofilin family)
MRKSKRFKSARITTLIGRDTEIHGDVVFRGGLHVEGRILGNVLATEDESAMLILAEGGVIEGEVQVANAIVNGRVRGDVRVSDQLDLEASARVEGNVHYHLLEMQLGAEVNGKLVHQDEVQLPRLEHQEETAPPAREQGVPEVE